MNSEPDDDFAISLLAAPGAPSAMLCLAGDIDASALKALSDATDRLESAAPTSVVIDVAEVTFTCSTMPNFLAGLHNRLPGGATILLCRPSPRTRRILQMTGMDQIAQLRDNLPTFERQFGR